MELHVADMMIRDNYPGIGETIDLFNQASLDKSFCPPEPLGVLHSLERVLLLTVEVVDIPEGYVGLVMLRSTVARSGLMAPVTYADPGFKGTLTMEMFNSNKWELGLRPGCHLWNMLIVPAPFELPYVGRYQGQGNAIVLPKALSFDKDVLYG
ncbi:MAG: hypothetical protein IH823_07095 [Candidatus Dadabacteria bacterium]|nr:hypothetical protein [Candidatus Dadabacteria bacterium]